MGNNIKFIYFDFGGVFFSWDNFLGTAASKFGFDRQKLVDLFYRYNEEITKGHITPQDLWEKGQKELRIQNAEDFNFIESWVEDYVPLLEMHQFAGSLSKQYPVGAISNIYKGMHPVMVKKGKVPAIAFESEILSCEVGMQKPDREIFELAQQKVPFSGKEILFIDDSKSYLEGAKQLGWQTFQFETDNPAKSIEGIKHMLA